MRQAKRANGAPLQSGAGVAPFLVRHRVQNELFLDIEPHPTRSARDIMAAPGDKFYDALLLAIRQAGAHGKPVTLKDVVGAKTRQQGPAWAKAAAADAAQLEAKAKPAIASFCECSAMIMIHDMTPQTSVRRTSKDVQVPTKQFQGSPQTSSKTRGQPLNPARRNARSD